MIDSSWIDPVLCNRRVVTSFFSAVLRFPYLSCSGCIVVFSLPIMSSAQSGSQHGAQRQESDAATSSMLTAAYE